MSKDNMVYLGVCAKEDPPQIGIIYKNNEKEEKKKMYIILLQRLIQNPNVNQVVEQLYHQHPHILKQNKISKDKIAKMFIKLQNSLNLAEEDYDDQEFQELQRIQKGQKNIKQVHDFQFDQDDQPHPKLNKSR